MNFVRICQRVPITLNKNVAVTNLLKPIVACYSDNYQHRRPSKVYQPDGGIEAEFDGIPKNTVKNFSKNNVIKGVIELDKQFSKKDQMYDKNEDEYSGDECDSENDSGELLGTRFVRMGDSDRTFDRRILNTQSRKQREKSKMIMLEGTRLIQDAISAKVIPTEIFFTRKSLVEGLSMPPGVISLFKMPYNKMKKWSPLQTPPGIVAFCKMPKKIQPQQKYVVPLTLICDNVRESGNLGAILRTVSGVGCFKVILTKGCVDLWDSKVLRAGAGAHFRVPVVADLTWGEINEQLDRNTKVFIAHHSVENNPMAENMLPTVPYFSVDYSCLSDIVVVVGGETEGISGDAIQAARYRDGLRINIPLSNNIDSLNVSAAISTILFEIKRQFIMNKSNTNYLDKYDNDNSQSLNILVNQ